MKKIILGSSIAVLMVSALQAYAGPKIKVKKVAPAGDPISIELRGYELCISKKDASRIIVSRSINV